MEREVEREEYNMKKNVLKTFSLIVLCGLLASQAFAANVYYPGGTIVSSNATNVIDPNFQLAISNQIRQTFSAFESKGIVQDVNALPTIRFGSYAFAGFGRAGDTIEWIVLEKTNTYAILLSKYILGESEYNETGDPVAYAGTKISKWVNKFYLNAFNENEKALIADSTIPSKNEIEKYFTYVDGTKKLGLAANEKGLGDYWLRNETIEPTGWYFSSYAECYNGQLGEKFGIRPMIVINLTPIG